MHTKHLLHMPLAIDVKNITERQLLIDWSSGQETATVLNQSRDMPLRRES